MSRCLLTVHAHPDDEASKGAATVALYHERGVRTVLVCCTGGEAGDILNPAMDQSHVRENLHKVRMVELQASATAIGYDEVVALGYRDSGMPCSEANAHPENFANADLTEAVARLVSVIRRVRPQVVITYPHDQSSNGHPDHIRVHEISVRAFDLVGDSGYRVDLGDPWCPAKLYYVMRSNERVKARHAAFVNLGLESPYNDERLERPAQDDRITTRISVHDHTAVRAASLRAHATQIDPLSSRWFGLPDEVERLIHPFDEYQLARGPMSLHTRPPSAIEDDLFAGLAE